MKVSEFIKWLEKQDQNAVVEVIFHEEKNDYYLQGGWAEIATFKPEFSEYSKGVYEYPSTLLLGRFKA